jgi:ribosomal protein S28E/S33
VIGAGPNATNTVIPRMCKNPVRAIKLLELMNTKEERN